MMLVCLLLSYGHLQPQYVFIHDALLEALECGVTEVAARNLKEQYRGLGIVNPVTAKSRLQTEFANLDATVHAKPMISYAAMPTNKTKNRYANTDMIPCKLDIHRDKELHIQPSLLTWSMVDISESVIYLSFFCR